MILLILVVPLLLTSWFAPAVDGSSPFDGVVVVVAVGGAKFESELPFASSGKDDDDNTDDDDGPAVGFGVSFVWTDSDRSTPPLGEVMMGLRLMMKLKISNYDSCD